MITKIYNFKSIKTPTKNADAFSVCIFLKVLTCTLHYSVPSSCYWIRFTHSRSKKLTFLIISVAGLAWWYLNIHHTCDESEITTGIADPPGETQQTIPSMMSIATSTCVRALNYKKIPKSFLPVQGLSLIWKNGSKLYWARDYSFSVTSLFSFLFHLDR